MNDKASLTSAARSLYIWVRRLLVLVLTLAAVTISAEAQTRFEELKPTHTFELGGSPDWMVITQDAVWVANPQNNAIDRIDPEENVRVVTVKLPGEPCSGLAAGFGSIWVPICGPKPMLLRIGQTSNSIESTLLLAAGDSEGAIAVSAKDVWLPGVGGQLLKIDPTSNSIVRKIDLPNGSSNAHFAGNLIWVTCNTCNKIVAIDPDAAVEVASAQTGPKPRFLCHTGDAVWTLNQGDGSITKIDIATKMAKATINAGISGVGGEIAAGDGYLWASVFNTPLTRVDVPRSEVTKQWKGRGGDSVRVGFGSLWLTDYQGGRLWRFDLKDVSR